MREETKDNYFEPSDRLVPEALAENTQINNLLTRNWRDNAIDVSNSTMKQLIGFVLILGYFYCGSIAVESGDNVALGSVSLVYAASSLFGYFGLGNAPVAQLLRTNMVSVISVIMGLVGFITGGMNICLFLLTVMHMFDAYTGSNQIRQLRNDR